MTVLPLILALFALPACSTSPSSPDQPTSPTAADSTDTAAESEVIFRPRSKRSTGVGITSTINNPANVFGLDPSSPSSSANLPTAAVNVFTDPSSSPSTKPTTTPTAAPPSNDWTIALATFRGDTAEQSAQAFLQQIRSVPSLSEAFVERRGQGVIVALGRFSGPGTPEGTAALNRVHTTIIDNKTPFVTAFLAPPDSQSQQGTVPEYNLARAKQLFGKPAQWTLQVGIYGLADPSKRPTESDLKEIRQRAEEAVLKLRREGELAFYYHARERSTVTIGIFDDQAAGAIQGIAESQTLRSARERFPYNLLNGAAIRTRQGGRDVLQPSVVVRIPSE
ncbi:MAG: hypothetical protein IBJ18_12330 [Phycisphaerales bacterium]|nr:hypothetical protein [Phycisphaerales bacterium]